jgi:hypothetical protein
VPFEEESIKTQCRRDELISFNYVS